MNPLLLSILASRMGGGAPAPVAELLAQVMGGSADGGGNTHQDLLAQLANGDSAASLIARQIMERQAKPIADNFSVVRSIRTEEVPTDVQRRGEIEFVATEAQTLPESPQACEDTTAVAELQELRRRNDDLAHAVGA